MQVVSEDFKKRLDESLKEIMSKSYAQLKKEIRIKKQVEKFVNKKLQNEKRNTKQ